MVVLIKIDNVEQVIKDLGFSWSVRVVELGVVVLPKVLGLIVDNQFYFVFDYYWVKFFHEVIFVQNHIAILNLIFLCQSELFNYVIVLTFFLKGQLQTLQRCQF